MFCKVEVIPMGRTMGKIQLKLVGRIQKVANHHHPTAHILVTFTIIHKLLNIDHLNTFRTPQIAPRSGGPKITIFDRIHIFAF